MKKMIAVFFALAAFGSSPAFGQDEMDSKACMSNCKEALNPSLIKKGVYDYEAVQNDVSLSDAEKKKRHKQAVAGVCKSMCNKPA